MAKQIQKVSFTFINPNRADVFERVFRKVLVDRLAALCSQTTLGHHP